MNTRLSLYAPEPGGPGFPAASGSAVFVKAVAEAIRSSGIDLSLCWLPAGGRPRSGRSGRAYGQGFLKQLWRAVRDSSRYILFLYPPGPSFELAADRVLLARVKTLFRALRLKARITRQDVLVVVQELPLEQQEARARAGELAPEFDVATVRAIEATILRGAHRLALPLGLADATRERYRIDSARVTSFRRQPYLPSTPPTDPPAEFDAGVVNFFYSGAVDSSVAANFREILKAIRNAPTTRLHVCGPGREAVEEWLAELAVPNVRHYGQLDLDAHDWVAQQCDVGLILHPTDNTYNHLRPTLKYSAYLANGLAVLSTDLDAVAANLRRDGVGLAMPIRELAMELMRWATRPTLWTDRKAKAESQSGALRSGDEIREWIESVTSTRRSRNQGSG